MIDLQLIGHWEATQLCNRGGYIKDGAWNSKDNGESLLHGPYIHLPCGTYVAKILYEYNSTKAQNLAYIDVGNFYRPVRELNRKQIPFSASINAVYIDFIISDKDLENIEIRSHSTDEDGLKIYYMEIYRSIKDYLDKEVWHLCNLVNIYGVPREYDNQDEYDAYNSKAVIASFTDMAFNAYRQRVKVMKSPKLAGLCSKACTQADMESEWAQYWLSLLGKNTCAHDLYHKKNWEYAYLLQVLFDNKKLNEHCQALGFGVGSEPVISVMAANGVKITATDKPEGGVWAKGSMYAKSKEILFYPNLVSREMFDKNVCLQYVDMNDLPSKWEGQFDIVYSLCALEHLGSIENGLRFVRDSLKYLKPGGIAIHTTELNITNSPFTCNNIYDISLYRRTDFEQLAHSLYNLSSDSSAYKMDCLDFTLQTGMLDRFVMPHYAGFRGGRGEYYFNSFKGMIDMNTATCYLKCSMLGWPFTSFGFIIRRII